MDNTPIGDRMKNQYENRTRYYLPRRTYTIIRIDGKAFHTLTKNLDRPFDEQFARTMYISMMDVSRHLQGFKVGYWQSDEVSFLLTDFDKITTEAWFDGNIQKMVSVSASLMTEKFIYNATYEPEWYDDDGVAHKDPILMDRLMGCPSFDARVFTIPDRQEVINYFIWRQQDAERNSIQMAAQSVYSHKELHGKSCDDLQEMLFKKGINWNDYPNMQKRGVAMCTSGAWDSETPIFTKDRKFLEDRIPVMEV